MNVALETLPSELLTLWPKLGRSYRLLRGWDRRGGILFITDDDQGLTAARQVATALRGRIFELPLSGLPKKEFERVLRRHLEETVTAGTARAAEIERLCIIIPRIDMQAKWLRDSIKRYCEVGERPLALLLTCRDLDWMESSLRGHLFECRKKGAPRRTPGQRALVKQSKKRAETQRSFLR
jgi:hypothetical protein